MVGKIAAFGQGEPESCRRTADLPFLLAHPCRLGAAVDGEREAAGFPELFVHRFAHAFQQRRDIQEIIRRGAAHFARQLAQVHIQSEQTAPQQASQQHDPGAGKTEWQVVEHAVLPGLVFHQQIKASGGAAQHVADIAGGQNDAFGLARCPRRVDDGDGIRIRELWVSVHAGAGMGKYFVEQILRRGLRPGLQNAIAQGGIAAADECRRAILHHG